MQVWPTSSRPFSLSHRGGQFCRYGRPCEGARPAEKEGFGHEHTHRLQPCRSCSPGITRTRERAGLPLHMPVPPLSQLCTSLLLFLNSIIYFIISLVTTTGTMCQMSLKLTSLHFKPRGPKMRTHLSESNSSGPPSPPRSPVSGIWPDPRRRGRCRQRPGRRQGGAPLPRGAHARPEERGGGRTATWRGDGVGRGAVVSQRRRQGMDARSDGLHAPPPVTTEGECAAWTGPHQTPHGYNSEDAAARRQSGWEATSPEDGRLPQEQAQTPHGLPETHSRTRWEPGHLPRRPQRHRILGQPAHPARHRARSSSLFFFFFFAAKGFLANDYTPENQKPGDMAPEKQHRGPIKGQNSSSNNRHINFLKLFQVH